MSYLLYEETGQVATLTIHRPKALNALNVAVIDELSEALDRIGTSDVRVLILSGAGEKSFVAGADIAEMKDLSPTDAEQFSRAGLAVFEKLERLPMPTIAAINGFALGGGCELALACDIRLAAESAVFALPEVGLGIIPGYGGVQRLIRVVGPAHAKELTFTARRVDAAGALAIGLVNGVYPKEKLMDAALAMAEAIAANAPVAVRAVKQIAGAIAAGTENITGLATSLFGSCFGTDDQKQAMAAFVEKRKRAPFAGV